MAQIYKTLMVAFNLQMSKSKGNVTDPLQQIFRYGVDPMRYFLLKEGSLQHDGGDVVSHCGGGVGGGWGGGRLSALQWLDRERGLCTVSHDYTRGAWPIIL